MYSCWVIAKQLGNHRASAWREITSFITKSMSCFVSCNSGTSLRRASGRYIPLFLLNCDKKRKVFVSSSVDLSGLTHNGD